MFRSLLIAWVVVSLCSIAACSVRDAPRDGSIGPGTDAPGSGGPLRIEPLDRVEALTIGTPVVVDYRAFLAEGGGEREVTSEVTWSSSSPGLGTFTGATFTSAPDRGGVTTISARMGSAVAATTLTITATTTIIADGAPADAPSRFDAATPDPSVTPSIVYPLDAVVIPPNLSELEFHYLEGGATIFELAFDTPSVDLRIYFGCPEAVGGGCIYTPDHVAWEAISTAAAGAGSFTYTLRGIDASGRLGTAASQTMMVAAEPITGGLYYWHASSGNINRFEFGVRGARAERYLTRMSTGGNTCIGCHALSRDGTRMTVGSDTPTEMLSMFDVATRTSLWRTGTTTAFPLAPPSPDQPNFVAVNTTGSLLAGSSLEGITIRDGNTGTILQGPIGPGASEMPDFSPDGNHIVFVSVTVTGPVFPGLYDLSSVSSGSIRVLDFDGVTYVDRGTPLVASEGDNNYYPTYTPDGEFIVYNRSPSNTPSMGMDASSAMTAYVPDAELWVIPAGGGTPIEMESGGNFAEAWPKFDPTMYTNQGRPLYWMAWSSRRAFGLRYDESGPHAPQLWMAAFDPTEAAAGRDPLAAAFWLPFQDIATGNHIAQWVTRIERMSCDDDTDCGGEFCVDGRCYAEQPAPF